MPIKPDPAEELSSDETTAKPGVLYTLLKIFGLSTNRKGNAVSTRAASLDKVSHFARLKAEIAREREASSRLDGRAQLAKAVTPNQTSQAESSPGKASPLPRALKPQAPAAPEPLPNFRQSGLQPESAPMRATETVNSTEQEKDVPPTWDAKTNKHGQPPAPLPSDPSTKLPKLPDGVGADCIRPGACNAPLRSEQEIIQLDTGEPSPDRVTVPNSPVSAPQAAAPDKPGMSKPAPEQTRPSEHEFLAEFERKREEIQRALLDGQENDEL